MREARGELEAAQGGTIGSQIKREHIRGDLHMHTVATDGSATIKEMAEAALERGHRYIAITDHSKASFQANGLDEERLRQQLKEVAEVNQRLKDEGVNFRLLSGSEVDIATDGSLEAARLHSYDKLQAELAWQIRRTTAGAERARNRAFGRVCRRATKERERRWSP